MTSSRLDLDVVVVSYESRDFLERCLDAWAPSSYRPLVVDNGSSDGSAELAQARGLDVLDLPANGGFGAAANAGIEATAGRAPFVLVSNADAWPREPSDPARLVAEAGEREQQVGAIGPRLVGIDATSRPALLEETSRWWTGSGPVASSADDSVARRQLGHRGSKFLSGAAILLRRASLDAVGAFDPAFLSVNADADLCRRLVDGGWKLATATNSTFVHVGGVSTRPRWDDAYREQIRGHLRMLDKHEGRAAAEHARRWLATSLGLRARLGPQVQRSWLQRHARWLRDATVAELLDGKPLVRNGSGSR
jgi:N-acetylglucosaminyl-diphospho-decaprenol L-rhamnosyltransferase